MRLQTRPKGGPQIASLSFNGDLTCLACGTAEGYGIYLTFGAGKKDLRDVIDEHAKMHELGIAHGHGGNSEAYKLSGKLDNHTHD